jgi:hypothetical protein
MIVAEVLYQSVYLAVRMEVVVIFVRFYCCWWFCVAIGCECVKLFLLNSDLNLLFLREKNMIERS